MKIIPYQDKYRDDLIFMILEAKNALGKVPGLNEDLLDIKKNYNKRKRKKFPFFIICEQTTEKKIGLAEVIYDRFTGKMFLGSCKMSEFYKSGEKSVYIPIEYKQTDCLL